MIFSASTSANMTQFQHVGGRACCHVRLPFGGSSTRAPHFQRRRVPRNIFRRKTGRVRIGKYWVVNGDVSGTYWKCHYCKLKWTRFSRNRQYDLDFLHDLPKNGISSASILYFFCFPMHSGLASPEVERCFNTVC